MPIKLDHAQIIIEVINLADHHQAQTLRQIKRLATRRGNKRGIRNGDELLAKLLSKAGKILLPLLQGVGFTRSLNSFVDYPIQSPSSVLIGIVTA